MFITGVLFKPSRLIAACITAATALSFGSHCFYRSKAPFLVEFKSDENRNQAVLIRDARLFTGKPGEAVREGMNILIRDGRIERIYPGKAKVDGAKVIDAAGMTVMPGLIDAHTHVGAPTSPPWLPSLPDAERNLATFLYAGVTTVLDQGGDRSELANLAKKAREGKIAAPRLYYAGKAFTSPDGHPAALIRLFAPWPIDWLLIRASYFQVRGDSNIAELVRENKEHGASYTKVYLDEIPLSAPLLSEPALKKIVAASRARGLSVMAHVGREEHLRMAMRAGITIFVHSPYRTRVSAATIREMKTRGIVMAPTVNVFHGAVELSKRELRLSALDRKVLDKKELHAMDNVPPDFRAPAEFESWLKDSEKHSEDKFHNLRAYKAAGITLIAASDSPNVSSTPGGALHREIHAFVKRGGHSPAQALSAATYIPGRLVERIGGEKGLGHIRTGAPADLLILGGKPDLDLKDLDDIRYVILKGRELHRRE